MTISEGERELWPLSATGLLMCLVIGCGTAAREHDVGASNKVVANRDVVSRIVTSPDGKGYLEVDGTPFLYLGLQNSGQKGTIGDSKPFATPLAISWLENHFEKTAHLNFKTIQVILRWWEIEPEEHGVYDFSVLEDYIDWCNEYDLYLDIVWMGTNSVGGSYLTEEYSGDRAWRHTAPTWTMDQERFWNGGHPHHGNLMFSPQLVGADADLLHGWEIDAVAAMFNHLANYDVNHRTIIFQVNNEPNSHPSWKTNKANVLRRLDDLAKAVKDSNYVVATRVNIYADEADADVHNEANIDCVGADPYSTDVSLIKKIALGTDRSPMTYVAENCGSYSNTTSLVLTALVNGGFYDVWQMVDVGQLQCGIYATGTHRNWALGTIPPKRHSARDMRNLNAGLNKMGGLVARAPRGLMQGFNIEANNPTENYDQGKDIGEHRLAFISNDRSVAMAVLDSDKLYCVSDTGSNATFRVTKKPDAVEVGYLDPAGNWVGQATRSSIKNGNGTYTITYNARELLRIDMPASPGIIVDNSDSACTFDSTWVGSTAVSGHQGANYQHDGTSGADASKWARWTPNIPKAGRYRIYMRWTQGDNRPASAPIEVKHATGSDVSKTVDQRRNGGVWNLIGAYDLSVGSGNHVTIRASSPGYTIADAVRFEPVGASGSPDFVDVPSGYWAEGHIAAVFEAGITNGCSQNPLRFCPEDLVTRRQMAAFVVRAVEGEPAGDVCANGSPFSDVPPSNRFCKYVKRLSELGITFGCGDGQFCPNVAVTREQAAAILVRAIEGEPDADACATESPFSDVLSTSAFCPHIKRLSELGLTNGCGAGNYCPGNAVNRAQMAVFLARTFLGIE